MGGIVPVTPNSSLRATLMLVFVELCLKQLFRFLYSDIDGDPSFVLGMDNSSSVDAEVGKPFLDVGDGFFFWCKHVVNLLRGPMLAKFLRIRIGSK